MSGAGSAEDALNQIKVVQGRDISLEEKNRLINNILSQSSRYVHFPGMLQSSEFRIQYSFMKVFFMKIFISLIL